jgi:hypothetical protein
MRRRSAPQRVACLRVNGKQEMAKVLQEERMNPMPTKCPVCRGDLLVSRLHCPSCETVIEGSFAPGGSPLQEAFSADQLRSLLPFARLNQEQLYFVLTFVRCEGRLNRMEEELSLSYPTLRGRLDDIVRAMGFEPARDETSRESAEAAAPPGGLSLRVPGAEERQTILDALNRGEINVEEARRRLRGEPPLPPQPELPINEDVVPFNHPGQPEE